jgi:hypothetical protein
MKKDIVKIEQLPKTIEVTAPDVPPSPTGGKLTFLPSLISPAQRLEIEKLHQIQQELEKQCLADDPGESSLPQSPVFISKSRQQLPDQNFTALLGWFEYNAT